MYTAGPSKKKIMLLKENFLEIVFDTIIFFLWKELTKY